jgi:hypothetical protein
MEITCKLSIFYFFPYPKQWDKYKNANENNQWKVRVEKIDTDGD